MVVYSPVFVRDSAVLLRKTRWIQLKFSSERNTETPLSCSSTLISGNASSFFFLSQLLLLCAALWFYCLNTGLKQDENYILAYSSFFSTMEVHSTQIKTWLQIDNIRKEVSEDIQEHTDRFLTITFTGDKSDEKLRLKSFVTGPRAGFSDIEVNILLSKAHIVKNVIMYFIQNSLWSIVLELIYVEHQLQHQHKWHFSVIN